MFQEYSDYLWLGLIFLLIWSVSFSLIYRAMGSGKRTQARLLPTEGGDDDRTEELVLGDLTQGLADQVPLQEKAKTALQRDLFAAGFYNPTSLLNYQALRTLLVVAPLVVAGLIALLVEQSQMWGVLVGGVIGAMLGFSLPRLFLFLRARLRSQQIERGLPVAVDMMTLCLTAGQNIPQTLQRVATELKYSHRVLADEFDIVRRQAQLRNLHYALQNFADRVQVPEVRNLAMILIQSERLGTDAGQTLLEYAANLRTSLRQRADAKAQRTMFWMLFPTLLCLWIPAGIILIGPAVLEFNEYRKGWVEQWRESRQELRELQRAQQPRPEPVVIPEPGSPTPAAPPAAELPESP